VEKLNFINKIEREITGIDFGSNAQLLELREINATAIPKCGNSRRGLKTQVFELRGVGRLLLSSDESKTGRMGVLFSAISAE
jgi:hypothetical protein